MRPIECVFAALMLAGPGLLSNGQATADAVSIYKCEVGGVPTFSDRPCSPQAELHELDDTSLYELTPLFYRHGYEQVSHSLRELLKMLGHDPEA